MHLSVLNVLQDNFMFQMVDAPTRNNALLDLLITNNTDLITDVEIRGNLGNSNHRSIGFSINHTNRKPGQYKDTELIQRH